MMPHRKDDVYMMSFGAQEVACPEMSTLSIIAIAD
jgi:hypothetical protein